MAYSVIVWLVDPGKHPQQDEEEELARAGRDEAPGASTGANVGYTLPRMRYGVYENQQDAETRSRRSPRACSRTGPCASLRRQVDSG